ncbi:MAG: molybdopterin-binding protein [Burkholderiales bacterium]
MAFGALIIGDEILSGKRQDKHFVKIIDILRQRGLDLAWCEYLGDDPNRITAVLLRTFISADIVFSFGGIGATPDDHTRQCAAKALGVPIARHPEAAKEIIDRFGDAAYPNRVRMAEFPQGAALVPNPFNRIAGFNVGHHYFLPGFPEMAWPMMEWVLDSYYTHLFNATPPVEEAIITEGAGEGDLIDAMNDIVARYPDLKLSSLPRLVVDNRRIIEIGIKGAPGPVAEAMAVMKEAVAALGYRYTDKG